MISSFAAIRSSMSLSKLHNRHPIIKIDTQGAEWLVWKGLREQLTHRSLSMVMELTPWALEPTVRTGQFLQEVLQHFYVIDLGNARQRFAPVTQENLDERLNDVRREAPYWSDILCISRSLVSAQRLINRISEAYRLPD